MASPVYFSGYSPRTTFADSRLSYNSPFDTATVAIAQAQDLYKKIMSLVIHNPDTVTHRIDVVNEAETIILARVILAPSRTFILPPWDVGPTGLSIKALEATVTTNPEFTAIFANP